MADALKGHQAGTVKIAAQRFGGLEINRAVFRSPDEERGVIADLGERHFQFREVGRPIPDDATGMTQGVILACGYAVALERVAWNFRSLAEQAAQPQRVKRAPALDRVAEEHGTEGAAQEGCKPLAMTRPGIYGRN